MYFSMFFKYQTNFDGLLMHLETERGTDENFLTSSEQFSLAGIGSPEWF